MNTRLYWLVVAVMAWGIQVAASPVEAQKVVAQEKVAKPATITDLTAQGNVSLNIKFIDQFDTMRRCEPGFECGKKLETTYQTLSKSLQEEEQKLAQSFGEFQGKAAALSETARKEEEKRLRRMEEDCKRKREECAEEMTAANEKITVGLKRDVDSAVARVAKRENIDAVIDTATGAVVYKKESLNITEKVIAELNTEHQVKVAAAKKQQADTVVAANAKAPVATVAPKIDATARVTT